jgi:hypothetical protein
MAQRLFTVLLLVFAISARAQVRVEEPRSIIVKFQTASAMHDAALAAKLRAVSASSDVLRPVFQLPKNGGGAQQVALGGQVELERIVQISLKEGLSAADAVKSIASASGVEYVEPNYRYHIQSAKSAQSSKVETAQSVTPNDSLFGSQWGLRSVHAPEAWEITEGDSTIHIGFVDTGVDWLHPDLKFQFAANTAEDINHNGLFDAWPVDSIRKDARGNSVHGDLDGIDNDGNGYADDVIGYDFVDQEVINVGDWSDRDPIPQDQEGHGTYMAGILAAQQNNVSGVSGIAPKCKVVAMRAFDANGTGEDDDIASAIVYAADNGVKILNLSFGDIIPSLLQRDAIRYAVSKGVTVFASSGNSGGDGPNYPSDFDEVVSVGATSIYPNENTLFRLNTHGEEMDVVAPGDSIWTTKNGGGYNYVSGTSASSPMAAGIAALLLSKNPNYTPLQLRSILESTTQDIADAGYDHRSANGRVDALRALTYKGAAAIKMATPQSMDEFHVGDTVRFTGSAMSTLFTGYSVDYAGGVHPDTNQHVDNWKNIATQNSQVLNGTLAEWHTRNLQPGYYTVRLAVRSSDSRSTEEHRIIKLAAAPPQFTVFEVDSIWINEQRGLLVRANCDVPAQLEVHFGNSVKSDDRIGFEHMVLIKREEVTAGVPFDIEAILRTPNGDESSEQTTATVLDQAVPEQGFVDKPYTLPSGFAMDTVLSLPSGDEVIETPDGNGKLTSFQFSGNAFHPIDSMNDASLPRALGNIRGDGKPELMTQNIGGCPLGFCGRTRVYKQNAQHHIFGDLIFANDTILGSTFATFDGHQNIVGSIDSAYLAFGPSGQLVGSMVNTSPADPYNTHNDYTEPHAAHADLRGDGNESIITLDNDADLVIYDRDASAPTGFRAVFVDRNNAASSGAFVTSGDFDGDGKIDIAYAYHPAWRQDTLNEYPPAYWSLKVLRNLGGMKFEPMLTDHFFGANQNDHFYYPSDRGNSVRAIRNVTGHTVNDLVLSFFPNFYLLEYDSSSHTMRPVWRYPLATNSNGAIAWDFDRNGKREFGFEAGDSIRFFERSSEYNERTPAPAGLIVSPRDTNRVDLEWAPVERATEYEILRAAPNDINWTVIDNTPDTRYTDSSVNNGEHWIYSVAAISDFYTTPESRPAFSSEAMVHPMPRLSKVEAQSRTLIVLHTTQPLRTQRIGAGAVTIDDEIVPASITIGADSTLLLGFTASLPVDSHYVRVSSFGLRDAMNSPFDTTQRMKIYTSFTIHLTPFYIVRWTFEQSDAGLRIHVVFNGVPADNALDVSHYALSPYGSLVRVTRDAKDSLALYIDVSSDVTLVGLGVPFVLCAKDITDIHGTELDPVEGNCAGVALAEQNLDHVMVYPNPGKLSDGSVMFARLTPQATIRIFSAGMHFIRQIATTEAQGGVAWDLRDDNGKLVPSGEYIYSISGKNADGIDVKSAVSKFVIVSDGAPR